MISLRGLQTRDMSSGSPRGLNVLINIQVSPEQSEVGRVVYPFGHPHTIPPFLQGSLRIHFCYVDVTCVDVIYTAKA
jgi:hypothetical protein